MPSACGTSRLRARSSKIAALLRIDVVAGEEALVDLRLRLRFELGRSDVEHVVEVMFDFEPAQHRVGMRARAVGQDELAAGELRDRRAERGVGRQRRVIDLMHDLQKLIRLQAVLLHQAAHGRAVAPVIILLQPERLVVGDLQKIDDVVADAHVDLLPQIEVMRIERVVEIEHPGLDVGETALGRAADGVIVHSRRLVVATVPGDEASSATPNQF